MMLTLREAATQLGVSPDTLRRQALDGKLRARKVGRDWHVDQKALEAYRLTRLGRHGRQAKA